MIYQLSIIFQSFLLCFALCNTSADLIPPFIQKDDGLIGLWELLGASQLVNENEIMLVPPLQYTKGSIWTSVELQKIDFQASYEIHIQEGTGGGGFAIWFIDQYGASGILNGGPISFKGIGLLSSLQKEGIELHFHLIQNNNGDQYHINSLPLPDFVMKVNSSQCILLTIQFNQGFINIYSTNLAKVIISEEMIVPIDNSFMGITAQTDSFTSKFILKRIELQIGQSLNKRKINHIRANKKNSIHYDPELVNPLRNPLFSSTILEIEKMREGVNQNEQASLFHLLSIIEESNFASYEVASFKELNEFISKSLIPFIQKWHKRTVKIVEESSSLRNTFNLAWNHTQSIIETFNLSVKKNLMKTKFKIIDLEDIMINDSNISYIEKEIQDDLIFNSNYSTIAAVLLIISMLEIFAVFILFIYMNNSSFRSRIKANAQ